MPVERTTRPTVLVVDDDRDILRLVGLALSQLPVEVVHRDRSFGVLNALAEHRPALVLLDVTMPGLDGSHVTELIRADSELRHTVVLLYSALDEADLARRADSCGADGYVLKISGPLALARAVRERLGL